MEIAAFIDWLSVTHHSELQHSHDAIAELPSEGRPMLGYTKGIVYPSGAIELWNEKRPDMGHHFVYTGKVLQRITENYGISRDDILTFHTQFAGRVSRIDFAIDVRDALLDLDVLWDALEQHQAQTHSKHTRTQSGDNKGTTVYVGSLKNRKKLLRMYDKAKEVGDFLSDYKRIELEIHGHAARNSQRLYTDRDFSPSAIIGMVRAFCDFPNVVQWQHVINAEPIKVPVGTHIQSDTEKWLLQIVAPAYARVLGENPEFHSSFMEAVKVAYNKA